MFLNCFIWSFRNFRSSCLVFFLSDLIPGVTKGFYYRGSIRYRSSLKVRNTYLLLSMSWTWLCLYLEWVWKTDYTLGEWRRLLFRRKSVYYSIYGKIFSLLLGYYLCTFRFLRKYLLGFLGLCRSGLNDFSLLFWFVLFIL